MSEQVKVGWYYDNDDHVCRILCTDAPEFDEFTAVGYSEWTDDDGGVYVILMQYAAEGIPYSPNDRHGFKNLKLHTHSATREELIKNFGDK